MFTHAPKVHTFAAGVQPGVAVIRRRYAGGICRFRGNSSNRNHSATGSLSMRTWVFLQTRISVPVFSLFRQWSQRGRARTTCFPFSDNFALPEDSKRCCCGWSSPEFAGMVHGNVSRPAAAAARKQLRTSLTTATLNMLTIWAIKTKKRRRSWATTKAAGWLRRSGCMSCGCCITQRWAHGRKTWQWHLLLQLVPLSQLSDSDRKAHGGFSAPFISTAELSWAGGRRFMRFLRSSSCLFTERRRFCSALPVWRSASGLIIHSTEQFKFTTVANNNWAGAAEVAWCYLQFRCLWGYFLFLFLPVCLPPLHLF